MSVNLRKGQKIELTKNNPQLKNVIVGLGWQVDSERANAKEKLYFRYLIISDSEIFSDCRFATRQ